MKTMRINIFAVLLIFLFLPLSVFPEETELLKDAARAAYFIRIAVEHFDNKRYIRVVQKPQFLNNFRLKTAKCGAFCETCSITRTR
jgi:hypothetical protein